MSCSLNHLGHRKNSFLVHFRLLVFVSGTYMFKNRFLVCFDLLVFTSDTCICFKIISWFFYGCWFPFVLRLCMTMFSS